MRAIAWAMLREFGTRHPDVFDALKRWFRECEKADWSCFADVRAAYPSVDQVGERLVFNVGGNKYRLIAAIDYDGRTVLVKWVGTHAEYDRIDARRV